MITLKSKIAAFDLYRKSERSFDGNCAIIPVGGEQLLIQTPTNVVVDPADDRKLGAK
jgi:hypothetical protein